MSDKRGEILAKCIEILKSHEYTVDTSNDGTENVRLYREHNEEKFALAEVDIVGLKKGVVQLIVAIEESNTPKAILGEVAVVDMANACLVREAGSDRKLQPLNKVVLFIVTPASNGSVKERALMMMLRDSYNFMEGNLRDFIVTTEDEFENELADLELYVV